MAAELFPGAPLQTGATVLTFGALAVVVRDRVDGRFYGVTARDLFRADDQPALTQSKKRIGKPTERFDRDRAPREPTSPIIDLVGFFAVDKTIEALDENPAFPPRITATVAAADVVDDPLVLLPRDGTPRPVRIVGFGMPFNFEDDRRARVITGGLEVGPENDGGEHARRGDAGAPLVTQDGRLVGVVVAVGEDSSIAAPLHEVFEEHGLEVYLRDMRPRASEAAPRYAAYAGAAGAGAVHSGNPRIAGVTIPGKRIVIALQYIHGIGRYKAETLLRDLDIPFDVRAHALTNAQVLAIREYIDRNYIVEGDLRRETAVNIKRLMDLACYRGLRHRKGLPVRGQRTHTNARTRKGPAKAIAGKKK